MNSRWRRTSSQRFGFKQISLLIGVIVLALLVVTVLAILEPPEKPVEKFVPTLIGPGLGD
jgi:hypothetical protein